MMRQFKPLQLEQLIDTLRLASQRFGNAAQGHLSQDTAMILMRRINFSLEQMEDYGLESNGVKVEITPSTFDHRPEYA